mgnify:CR=1 FL=1
MLALSCHLISSLCKVRLPHSITQFPPAFTYETSSNSYALRHHVPE